LEKRPSATTMPLTVFLAHSGKTLDLECTPSTPMHDIQRTLAALTGTAIHDQILVSNGAPTSPEDTVASINDGVLPSSHAVKSPSPPPNVFLYDKTCLLPDSPLPDPVHLGTLIEESLTTQGKETEAGSEVSSHAAMSEAHHELDDAPSPLLRALPEYYRQFCRDAKFAWSAVKEATGLTELCSRLVNEIEVQAMAVDSAMSSVQPHYEFVCEMHKSFEDRCASLLSKHEDVLQTFTADVECLRSIQLVDECASALRGKMPLLSQQQQQQQDKTISLADLLPLEELETIANETARSHRRLASRVKEVQRVHLSLRADVEALFLRSPSVDLDRLSQELIQVQAASSELETALQLLVADCERAKRAIEQGTSSSAEKMESVHMDMVGVLEAVHEAHVRSVLPRISECQTLIKSFATFCVKSKNVMAVDALLALRTIASEQSKIRQMKETLMPFPLAIDRQDSQVEKLRIVRRLPVAYKHALAECMRREAFNQKYKSFASDLEDRMNTFRFKEKSVRETFENKVKGVVPDALLSAMGLDEDPPLFKVVLVDSSESVESRLLHVVPDQLKSIHLVQHEVSSPSFLSGSGQTERKSQTQPPRAAGDDGLLESLNRGLSGAASISTIANPQKWQEREGECGGSKEESKES
jgi:hypothetical protein